MTMNRAARRRAGAEKPGTGLVIGADALKAPGHWHVDAVAFSHEEGGNLMNAIHLHNLVTNDLVLCEAYVLKAAKPLSGATRDRVRTEQGTMCDDVTHLGTAQAELLKAG